MDCNSWRSRSVWAAGGLGQQLLIEGVAIAGDARQERGQRGGGVVRRRPPTAHARRHEDGAGQHGGALEEAFVGGQHGGVFDAVHEGVEGDLANDVAAKPAAVVDLVRVPLAEDVVGPAVDRMAVVVGAEIDGHLVQAFELEARFREDGRIGFAEDLQGLVEDVAIAPGSDAGAAEVQWQRAVAFVLVRLALGPGFEDRDGTMADEVVQAGENGADASGVPVRVLLACRRIPHLQDGFKDANEKEGAEDRGVVEMGEQVGVMAAVGGQHLGGEGKDGLGLRDVAEGGAGGSVELAQACGQGGEQFVPGTIGAGAGETGIGVVDLALPARVRPAVGEVEVAQQCLGRGLLQRCVTIFHRCVSLRVSCSSCSIPARRADRKGRLARAPCLLVVSRPDGVIVRVEGGGRT